jgi:ABC-2 type transport system permease protein
MLNTDAADWVINEYIKLNKLPSETQSDEKGQIWNEAWEHTDSLWEPEPPMKLEFEEVHEGTIGTVESEKNTFQDSTISSSAFGMLIAFIMFLIMFNSSWLVDEKENGTLKRIISGPGALTALFAGNILSLLIIGILQVVLFSTICSIFFGVDIFTRTSSIIIIFIYLLCVIGISLFVSSILKTRIQLQTGAPLFSIITGFIGGCFWNFTDMGGIMKTISLFTPQGLALDLFSRYGQQISDKTIPAVTGTILTTTSAIILLALAIGLTLVSYVSIKRLRY